MSKKVGRTGLEIAIIGTAGRFPGAKDIDEFWENLKNGRESITFFSDEELKEAGLSPSLLQNPNYVKANGILEGFDRFDASFFGYIPSEAAAMPPQVRLFHECVWTGFENAGYVPESYNGRIGLYAGANSSSRWEALAYFSLRRNPKGPDSIEAFSNSLLTDKDNLTTRISYKFNLTGPSFLVYTACSTSLVALHLAAQGLINGDCEMAAAGGTSIIITQPGYLYNEGGILSPDGHNRAFDARAKGTVAGDGMGVVILKLLEDAENDGDYIHAVIKGSALNNDGFHKVGYTAPSIEGQAQVISTAQYIAEVEPGSITYIETHGTGTELGDPVEVAALKLAFGNTCQKNSCALGSVKSNIGHLNTAAGIASLIKAILMLKHGLIPPSLHYENPNPKIDFENSPFYVNTELKEWPGRNYPRRAGVNSFGIGGTNVHVILEEYKMPTPENCYETAENECALILLSARSQSTLEKITENLFFYLKSNPGISLPDIAYTLQVGRKHFAHRRSALCADFKEALDVLAPGNRFKTRTVAVRTRIGKKRPIVFLFPGQGAQYSDMGLDLYRKEKVFRQEMDRCFEILKPLMNYDLKEILYPSLEGKKSNLTPGINIIDQTEVVQPLLFAFEYSLAGLLISWGIEPDAMLGHSIGEYTAACLAGVFSLEDALSLVVSRGQLMQQMPGGAMLSAAMPEVELNSLLTGELSLAAVNSPSRCVVSGPINAIDAFETDMKKRGIECKRLHTSHAFHSAMMEPVLEPFKKKVTQTCLHKPGKPYISNISGQWIGDADAIDINYWPQHLRRAVRFSDGIKLLLSEDDFVFIEVGPGNSLTTLVKQQNATADVVNLLRRPKETAPDNRYLLDKIGQLWLYGINVDWTRFHKDEKRYRVPLPPYPFESLQFPIQNSFQIKSLIGMESLTKKPNIADWCYVPIWEQSFIPQRKGPGKKEPCHWLVFSDNSGLANRLINLLENRGNKVNVVETGPGFQIMAEKRYMIDPSRPEDYDSLFHDLDQKGEKPKCLLHLWNIEKIDNEDIDRFIDPCFYSLFNIVKGLDRSGVSGQIELYVVTSGLYKVNEDEPVYPLKAMIPAVLRTVRQEYSYITCRCIDIIPALPGTSQQDKLLENLDLELSIILSSKQKANVEVAAWRETNRWVQQFKPYPLEGKEEINKELLIRKGGVYLITGGMGGIGSVFARCLARDFGARLILVSRSPFPPEEQWEEWLRSHTGTDPVSIKIQECREMQAGGAQIMIASADVSNLEEMKEIIDRAEKRFGPINGLIHAAGVADYEGVIQRRNRLNTDKILAPKVKGTLVLDKILKNNNLDFAILCSSISFILAPVGQVGYNAANAFQDAFALAKGGRWMSIAWGAWQVGMSVEAVKKQNKDVANILEEAISPSEGMDILYLIFEYSLSRSVICPIDLNSLVEKMAPHDSSQDQTAAALAEKNGPGKTGTNVFAPRPSLSVDYIPPEDFFEKSLANNWQTYFGLDKVGIYDDFFELGGDSLKAMQVIANIQKEIGVTIPLGTFFESPNIKALAGFIRNKAAKDSYSAIENVEKKEFYELSPAQKRLYIQQQEDPSTIAYNLPRFYILEGNFDKEKSQNAFNELIKRHEILRTFFVMNKTGPVQRILDHIEFKIKDYDLKGKCKEEIMQTFISPFDLSRAPLLRVGIVDLEPGKFLLMIDIHHIAADGISLALLVNEFEALYKGHSLPALNLQYKDYSHWQNLHLSSGEIKRQEDYWTNLFTGEIPKLLLPLDFNRTMVRSSASNSISFSLGSEFEEKLRALAKEEEITLFISILAIYHILLFKISGQEDIIIGTVTSGRGHADLEKIIGMFVNTLALRNFSKPGKSFREFLFDVKKRTLAAFENQDFQFENLVEKLQDVREVGRNPLFDVVFSFISSAMLESELKEQGLKIRECTFKEGNTMFDFVLGVFDLDEKLGFVLQYNISLFKKSTIERFIIYFKEIVRSVLENKNIHIEDIMVSHDLQAAQSNIYKETQIDFEF